MKELTDKEFVAQYVPFRELKKVGFFGNNIKRTDYSLIVERVLNHYGTTKREWALNSPTLDLQFHPDFQTGRFPMTVDKDGKMNQDAFKLSF